MSLYAVGAIKGGAVGWLRSPGEVSHGIIVRKSAGKREFAVVLDVVAGDVKRHGWHLSARVVEDTASESSCVGVTEPR